MAEAVAKLAVEAAVYAIDKPYSYRLPSGMAAQVGMRCIVPFGKGNRRSEAVIIAIEQAETSGQTEGLKTIERLLDPTVVLSPNMLRLAAFMRERYFCTLFQAIRAILPAGMWFRPRQSYRIGKLPDNWQDICPSATAYGILELLRELGEADYDLLRSQFGSEPMEETLQELTKRKWLLTDTDFTRRIGDKTDKLVSLAICAEEAADFAASHKRTAAVQSAVMELLASVGSCAMKELRYYTAATAATISALEKKGMVTTASHEVLRLPEFQPTEPAPPVVLNEEQQTAFDGLMSQWKREKPGAALLYGVTGSGKTSVYIRLIDECLKSGRQAILMVPEIALTPQLVRTFTAHFGRQVALIHSSVPMAKRYDTFKLIRRAEAGVIIGTRSAVFAPAPNLGLVIVDEEQEHTYRSENAPRYNAIEVALYRGITESALVVLGSATPSVETMYRAKTGLFGLFTLKTRYNQKALPPVVLVDMKQELRNGNGSALSRPLLEALLENRRKKQQSILFVNRRGSSRMTVCADCGYVPSCPNCSVHLTYHQANGRLMCHYCGHSEPLPNRCPVCNGRLRQMGFGTQRVEEQLREMLPDQQVLRMDADTISASNPHEKLLTRFREERIPILLGTQMVTKGLNFENVTLVGVLNADMSLYAESYRAAENTFDLITQVVGRAGRGEAAGRALLQTMTPENSVLRLAAEQDYDSFYETEIRLRELRGCPPFRDLVTIHFSGTENGPTAQAAELFVRLCQPVFTAPDYRPYQILLLGPSPAPVMKVSGRYRYRVTVGCRLDKTMRLTLAQLLKDFARDRRTKGVTAFAEVNGSD